MNLENKATENILLPWVRYLIAQCLGLFYFIFLSYKDFISLFYSKYLLGPHLLLGVTL